MFDTSISLGNILTVVAFIAGGFGFAYSIKTNLQIVTATTKLQFGQINEDLKDFKSEIKKLNDVIIQIAAQGTRIGMTEERLMAQGKRLDDLVARVSRMIDHKVLQE